MHLTPSPARVRRVAVWFGAVALFLLGACNRPSVPTGTDPAAGGASIKTVPPTVGPTGCSPGSPGSQLPLGWQVRGSSNVPGEAIWALFQTNDGVHAGHPIKVYWRIAGNHALRITLIGEQDELVYFNNAHPEPLAGWTRPGEPWVSDITFPQPGCWRIFVERGSQMGDLWMQVS
jgi:hypothetical protein